MGSTALLFCPLFANLFLQFGIAVFLVLNCGKKKPDAAPAGNSAPTAPTGGTDNNAAGGAVGTTANGSSSANAEKTKVTAPSGDGAGSANKDPAVAHINEEPDLRSKQPEVKPANAAQDVAPADNKPPSARLPTGNEKFISKGNGNFLDKDGNPISQFAEPPPKDDG